MDAGARVQAALHFQPCRFLELRQHVQVLHWEDDVHAWVDVTDDARHKLGYRRDGMAGAASLRAPQFGAAVVFTDLRVVGLAELLTSASLLGLQPRLALCVG